MNLADYAAVAVFVGFGLIFVSFNYFLNSLVTAKVPEPQKYDIYECGEVPQGTAQIQYNVRYFIFALIFCSGLGFLYKENPIFSNQFRNNITSSI